MADKQKNTKMPSKCIICSNNLCKSKGSVKCRCCAQWAHTTCTDLTSEQQDILIANTALSYVCPSCGKQETNTTISTNDTSLSDEVKSLKKMMQDFITRANEERNRVDEAMDAIVSMRKDMDALVKDIKFEVSECRKEISHVEAATSNQFSLMQLEINSLQRKLNRGDVIISGMPKGLTNLVDPIIQLGDFLNISISKHDICGVHYINGMKSILVKFNNYFMRDDVIKFYFQAIKTKPLMVSHLIKSNVDSVNNSVDIHTRVYLNEHFTPAAGKLNALCKKLLNKKLIFKFKVLNYDNPKAKLLMPDGKELYLNALECQDILNKDNVASK